MIKYKNPSDKPAAHLATQNVFNGSVGKEEEMDEFYDPDYDNEDTKEEKTLIRLSLSCCGRSIIAVIDTRSQLNIVYQAIADEIIRLPINITQETTMNDVNGNCGTLEGLIKKVPLRCGEVLTEANLYVGNDKLPFDLLLGCPWQRRNMISIDERKNGTYLVFKNKETCHPHCEVFITPTQLVPRPKTYSPIKVIRKEGVYAALEGPKIIFVEEEQAKATEESPQMDLDISQNKSTTETLEEIPAGPLKTKDLKVEEEIDNGIFQDPTVGFMKLNLEHPSESQAKSPAQSQNKLSTITSATSVMEDPDQDIMTGSKIESRLDPESKSDISVWPKSAQCRKEDVSRDKDITERQNRFQETAESLDKEIGGSHTNFECYQCFGHSFKDCCQNIKTEKLPECNLEESEPPESETEYFRLEKFRANHHMVMSTQIPPKADRSTAEQYIYITRRLKTKPHITFYTMPTSTRAYEYPFRDAIEPTTGAPMHLVQSTIARMHAQQVLSRTNFSHIPPSPLILKAGNVLLATNQRVPDDSVAPFSIAELVSHDVSLQFLVDGLVKTLTGEVYIQFTYFF